MTSAALQIDARLERKNAKGDCEKGLVVARARRGELSSADDFIRGAGRRSLPHPYLINLHAIVADLFGDFVEYESC